SVPGDPGAQGVARRPDRQGRGPDPAQPRLAGQGARHPAPDQAMTDYRRFLGTPAPTGEVLAYFGGPYVQAGPRRLSVQPPGPPGFFRFAVTGRSARVVGPAE